MTHAPAVRIAIDLGSDTSTRPSAAMLAAMTTAPVGDEQQGEDPTTAALEARVAEMLGKEAAVFLPSGTMCNQIALVVHTRPGDEVICAESAHIFGSEAAGIAVLGGALIHPIPCARGIFGPDELSATVRRPRMRAPRSSLVVMEQTSNRGGGAVWPLATIEAVAERAREHGLAVHMDGARLLNACAATNIPAADFARPFDTAWLDFSKGLGTPVGAVLAGPRRFIQDAWVWKHRLGGAMRQSGVLAAACLYALDHNVDRLVEDHDNARHFAGLAAAIPGVRLDPAVIETNIVFMDLSATGIDTGTIAQRLRQDGVRIMVEGPTRMRAVTHLDVSRAGVEQAAAALARAVAAGPA